MRLKCRCAAKVVFQKTRAIQVYYWDGPYNKQQQNRWQGGSGKRNSSNEGRTHSCALLRIPTTLSCGKNRMYEMGSKHRCVVKVSCQKTRAIEVYYWEGSYNKQQQSRWQGGSGRRKSSNGGRTHSRALLRRPTTSG